MKTIFKYQLALTDEQTISLPVDAKILSIQEQGEYIFAWVSLDTDQPKWGRKIYIAGTGNSFDCESLRHITTLQMGDMVWHFFE